MQSEPSSPVARVMISYKRQGSQLDGAVLTLATRLRNDGLDCRCDQFVENPPLGWQRWMVDEIVEANYVLVICSEQYRDSFEGKNPPERGLGANWEGAIITVDLYERNGRNDKFIPVVLRSRSASAGVPCRGNPATSKSSHSHSARNVALFPSRTFSSRASIVPRP